MKRAQSDDITCQRIEEYVTHGWPDRARLSPEEKLYSLVAAELSIEQGCDNPPALRQSMLTKIHTGHQGITKCRERAKQSVWWPGLSKQIEDFVDKCDKCAKDRHNRVEPMIPSDVPKRPWQKLGLDLFELNGASYLLVVDYMSAFVEIAKLSSTTSAAIVNHMRSMFARHGDPEVVVTDNGPQYASETFRQFAADKCFEHKTCSPRFPQCNGEAERAVQTLKRLLAQSDDPYETLQAYRSTPLRGGYSPAELLMGRKIRTAIPVMPKSTTAMDSSRRGSEDTARRQKPAETRIRQTP